MLCICCSLSASLGVWKGPFVLLSFFRVLAWVEALQVIQLICGKADVSRLLDNPDQRLVLFQSQRGRMQASSIENCQNLTKETHRYTSFQYPMINSLTYSLIA